MMDSVIIESEALALSPLERARLADKLLNSLSDPDQDHILQSWVHIAEKRLTEHESGAMQSVDGPSYLSGLRSSLIK